jgi:alkanesulfonate monooxygenase
VAHSSSSPDGDFCDKAARYRRTDEFLDIVRMEWSYEEPFDRDGDRPG